MYYVLRVRVWAGGMMRCVLGATISVEKHVCGDAIDVGDIRMTGHESGSQEHQARLKSSERVDS